MKGGDDISGNVVQDLGRINMGALKSQLLFCLMMRFSLPIMAYLCPPLLCVL